MDIKAKTLIKILQDIGEDKIISIQSESGLTTLRVVTQANGEYDLDDLIIRE